jgi:hypothetical protein
MNHIKLIVTVISVALFFSAGFSLAEDIRIPVGQQAGTQMNVATPKTGMTKEKVRAEFGEPLSESAAVGQPPISQWKYPEFSVYFEYDHVIHSVRQLNAPAPSATSAPAPDVVQ